MNPRILVLGLAAAVGIIVVVLIARAKPAKKREPLLAPRPAQFLTDVTVSEETSDAAGGAIKKTFVKGLRNGDRALAESGLTADFQGRFPKPGDGAAVPENGLRFAEYREMTLPDLDRKAFVDTMLAHTAGWTLVERTTWRTFEFLLRPDRRAAWARIHFQVAGPTSAGLRGDVQATIACELVMEGETWKLRRVEIEDGFRVDADRPPFAEIADLTGFTWNLSDENVKNLIGVVNERGPIASGGLTACDWNRDGYWDIIATLANKTGVVFVNDGQGGFTRQALPFTRQEEFGEMTAYVDLDGDGLEELVSGQPLGYEGNKGWMGVYTRRNGQWVHLPRALEFETPPGVRGLVPYVVLPHDVDADGRLDLFVGIYGSSNSFRDRFNTINALDAGDDLLFMNKGGLTFREESAERGMHDTHYTFAAAFFDLDEDGDDDLIQVNDYAPDIYWENTGGGRFKEDKNHFLAQGSSYGMGLSIADYDNTGRWAIHISNMYSHAGNRIVPLAAGLPGDLRQYVLGLAMGDWQWEQGPDGRWAQVAVERGVSVADWAWACPFFDFDNDNDRDLFVTNGFNSHEDRSAPDY